MMDIQFRGMDGQFTGGVDVMVEVSVMVGVGETAEKVDVKVGSSVSVGGMVAVAVTGRGEGRTLLVAVGFASGTNSTREMDNAPIINPTDTRAIVSA
jgi:hypothetical protein